MISSTPFILFIDGASKKNPGQAGIGFVLYHKKKIVKTGHFYIGIATNNNAEYCALLIGIIESYKAYKMTELTIYTDSKLMAEQINLRFAIKNQVLKNCFLYFNEISCYISMKVHHILRHNNKDADYYANLAVTTKNPLPDYLRKKLVDHGCLDSSVLDAK